MRDKELLNELIIESREHLQSIEPDLLALEQEGSKVSEERINRIFRAVHSIKGGFAFFGVDKVVRLSHAMENIVGAVRDKKMVITAESTDALLRGLDKLRTLLDDIGNAAAISIDEELGQLTPFMPAGSDSPPPSAKSADRVPPKPEVPGAANDPVAAIRDLLPGVSAEQVLRAVREGKTLYHITVATGRDILDRGLQPEFLLAEWEKVGEILVCTPPREQIPAVLSSGKKKTKEISLVFASVLEPDLIGAGLGIAQEQILTVSTEECRKTLRAAKAPPAPPAAETTGTAKETRAAAAAPTVPRNDTTMEDALRVRVSLLNNMMNYAGELVLARNQLLQLIGRRCNDNPLAERNIRTAMQAIRDMVLAASRQEHHSASEREKAAGALLVQIDKVINRAFSFPLSEVPGAAGIIQNVDMVTTMLQEAIMQTRLQPISVVFSKFPRVIRDLAKKLGKEIALQQEGQDVELDKSIIELLSDPLTHLVRNCADHGIESPQERERKGKEPAGHVTLRAYQEGGKVIIEVEDDGNGIDVDRVRQKALEQGIIKPETAQTMTAKEAQMLVFAPGFSTATVVSDVSGRGVGMDVVKTNVERLGGSVEVDSTFGKGTRITMKLPLTLAIIPSLLIMAEGRRFAIPQVSLEEIVRIRADDVTRKIERIHDSEVLRLREKLLPLVRLSDVLQVPATFENRETARRIADRRRRFSDRRGVRDREEEMQEAPNAQTVPANRRGQGPDRRKSLRNAVKVIVLRLENNHFGLIVDEVLDSEEIVVKPLPEYLKQCQCYAGATIMGDGKVAMILDPNGIAVIAGLNFRVLEKEAEAEQLKARRGAARNLESVLLFSLGGAERFAVNLSDVARIEKRKHEEIEVIGSAEFVKYENTALRLVRLERFLPVQTPPGDSSALFLVVPKHARRPVAICASIVSDAVQAELVLDTESIKGAGIRGSAIINKKMTVILDMERLLQVIEETAV